MTKAMGKQAEEQKQIPYGNDKQENRQRQKQNRGVPPLRSAPVGMTAVGERADEQKLERLQKILAAAGVASRRKAEQVLLQVVACLEALPEDQQRATEAGFNRHLAKPPSLTALRALLGGDA